MSLSVNFYKINNYRTNNNRACNLTFQKRVSDLPIKAGVLIEGSIVHIHHSNDYPYYGLVRKIEGTEKEITITPLSENNQPDIMKSEKDWDNGWTFYNVCENFQTYLKNKYSKKGISFD